MKKIGLLSDTHGYIDDHMLEFFMAVDEIWHAGDIGSIRVLDTLKSFRPTRAVYGNIDDSIIRQECEETAIFEIEGIKVLMTHIGGYPGKYERTILNKMYNEKPDIFISGHSHILKVIFDKKLNCLHMNPGAAGKYGLHQVRTMIRFAIDTKEIKDLEIWNKDR